MNNEMPSVLESAFRHAWILGAARKELPVVLDGRHVAQHAPRHVRSLWKLSGETSETLTSSDTRRTASELQKKKIIVKKTLNKAGFWGDLWTSVRSVGSRNIHVSGHVLHLVGALPPRYHGRWTGTGARALDLVRLQRR